MDECFCLNRYLIVCLGPTCVLAPAEAWGGCQSPGTGVIGSWEWMCGCWDWNLGFWEGSLLLTAGQFPRPSFVFFKSRSLLTSPGWPGTHRTWPPSASWALGLKMGSSLAFWGVGGTVHLISWFEIFLPTWKNKKFTCLEIHFFSSNLCAFSLEV